MRGIIPLGGPDIIPADATRPRHRTITPNPSLNGSPFPLYYTLIEPNRAGHNEDRIFFIFPSLNGYKL